MVYLAAQHIHLNASAHVTGLTAAKHITQNLGSGIDVNPCIEHGRVVLAGLLLGLLLVIGTTAGTIHVTAVRVTVVFVPVADGITHGTVNGNSIERLVNRCIVRLCNLERTYSSQ